jgi:intein/homing endonuclease
MKVTTPGEITEDLAEETGWHIGDGSMNFYNNQGKSKGIYQLRGHIEDDKKHYIERIKPIFDRLYKTNISLREMPSTRVYGFQIWSNELVKFKKNLGLPLGKKFELEIPECFLEEDQLVKAVIRGIFDTDGSIYLEKKNNKVYPRVYVTTISKNLADQLFELLNRFGLRTTVYSQLHNKDFNRQRAYSIVIRGVEMLDKFMKEIAPKNEKHIAKYKKFLESKAL